MKLGNFGARRCRAKPIAACALALALAGCLGDGGGSASGAAPAITTQPASASVSAGATVSFAVAASGSGISYQWQTSADGGSTWTDIAGANAASYSTTAAQAASGSEYRVVITGGAGTLTSQAATLTVTAPASAALITGTAATGAALARATVAITNSAGTSPCQETAIFTDSAGHYTCTLVSGAVAPFFIVVQDATGSSAPVVGATASTPGAGTTLVVNATPLTTAVLAQLAPSGQVLSLVASGSLNAGSLQQITAALVAQLANVLASLGIAPGFDPFATPIVAATAAQSGNSADQLLDIVSVVTDPATGALALTTADNPTPVLLASAGSAGAVLAAPAASLSALTQAAQAEAQALTACFALPTAQRVLANDPNIALSQGGASVTSSAAACQAIAASAGSAAGIDFLHNGYSFGQYFYALLTSDSMTGASFQVPAIMAFYPAASSDSGQDEAVLNLFYVDANGNPGNLIVTARNIPGSSTAAHATTWWLTGNQQTVDLNFKPQIRKTVQVNAASSLPSMFQSSIQVLVNALGPGSVTAAGTLSYARVSGPGLPTSGLVLVAPVALAEPGQKYMDIQNKNGVIGGANICYSCPNYYYARTVGLSGTAATTLAPNLTGLTWAPSGTDTSGIVKGARYKFELFYGASQTPGLTVYRRMLESLVPATQGVNLAWNSDGPKLLALLDPANTSLNGVLASATINWVQNPASEQIRSINPLVGTWPSVYYAAAVPVAPGATSLTLTPTPSIPALSTTTSRAFLLHYRTRTDIDKTTAFTFN